MKHESPVSESPARDRRTTAKAWWQRRAFWLSLSLLLTLLVTLPNLNNGWVNWDDEEYVLNNALVHSISPANVWGMFTTLQVLASYHPLTLLSWSVDFAIGGGAPGVFHTTNVLWHLANVALVFWFIHLLCGRVEVAAIVALLFGIHPMHVESVAWISGRKDLLYGCFFLLGLVCYLRYLEQTVGRWRMYLLCLTFFLLSLLSKGVALTFPIVLLAVDYFRKRQVSERQLWEKVPFIILSVAFGILAVLAQQQRGAMQSLNATDYSESLFVAAYGTVVYVVKMLVPFQLSAFHPFPEVQGGGLPWYFYASALPVALFLIVTYLLARKNRQIGFGVAFFFVCMAPVLQLLPFGDAVIAERYTYIPYIGLFFLVGLATASLSEKRYGTLVKAVLAGYVVLLGLIAFDRSDAWENSETLWTDVIEKYPDHYFAYQTRAMHRTDQGSLELAIQDYNECLNRNPRFYEAYNDRGLIFLQQRKYKQALTDFDRAIELNDRFDKGYVNRGIVFMRLKQNELALSEFNKAIAVGPDNPKNYSYRGAFFEQMGPRKQAIANYSTAIRLDPENHQFYEARAKLHYAEGKADESIADFNKGISLNPNALESIYERGMVYLRQRMLDAALADFTRVVQRDTSHVRAYLNRGLIYLNQQDYGKALEDFSRAIELDSEYNLGYYNRGLLYEQMGRYEDAISDFERAIRLAPENPSRHKARGTVYYRMGDLNSALADFSTTIRLNPNDAEASYKRSLVLRDQGQKEEALLDALRARQLNYPVTQEYLDSLKE